jgi:carbonic anhydrase
MRTLPLTLRTGTPAVGRVREGVAASEVSCSPPQPVFVVLGHEGCGAVAAALDAIHRGVHQRSRIQRLLENIIPGIAGIEPGLAPDEELQRGVEANVRWSIHQLMAMPEAHGRAAEGEMKLVGAVYQIATGRVRFFE